MLKNPSICLVIAEPAIARALSSESVAAAWHDPEEQPCADTGEHGMMTEHATDMTNAARKALLSMSKSLLKSGRKKQKMIRMPQKLHQHNMFLFFNRFKDLNISSK